MQIKQKNREISWSDNRLLNWKILKYFNKVQDSYFSTYCQNYNHTAKLQPNQTLFDNIYSTLTSCFWPKKVKYANDFQNWNFSASW